MTLEEVDKIIQDLRQQIPQMQMQLHQAEGYKQALMDFQKKETEEKDKTRVISEENQELELLKDIYTQQQEQLPQSVQQMMVEV